MIYTFLATGIITGLFYGWNDYRIYFYPHTDKYYKGKIPPVNWMARLNALWIHLVCGVIGTMALYIFYTKLNTQLDYRIIHKLNWQDFIVLLIGILGITGLLPRTLWFFASKPDISGLVKK